MIKDILLQKGLTPEEADTLIQHARDEVKRRLETADGNDYLVIDEDICKEILGVDPIHFDELLQLEEIDNILALEDFKRIK